MSESKTLNRLSAFGAMIMDIPTVAAKVRTSDASHRCGESGHKEAVYLTEKCMACDRSGLKSKPHRPGPRKRSSLNWMRLPNNNSLQQVNLHTTWAAQQLFAKTISDLDVGLLILSEHYRSPNNFSSWASSSDSRCSIALMNSVGIIADEVGCGPGFAWHRFGGLRVFNCYWTPNGDNGCHSIRCFPRFS